MSFIDLQVPFSVLLSLKFLIMETLVVKTLKAILLFFSMTVSQTKAISA